MVEKEKKPFGGLKLAAQKGLASIDVEALKEKAAEATGVLKDKAVEVKDAAVAAKDEIADKLTELDRMLQGVVTEYNDAYTIMNDKGVQLFVERSRAVDSITFVESLVNSIGRKARRNGNDGNQGCYCPDLCYSQKNSRRKTSISAGRTRLERDRGSCFPIRSSRR